MSEDAAWVLGIIILIIFCAGDPDLLDAIIFNLMGNGCAK